LSFLLNVLCGNLVFLVFVGGGEVWGGVVKGGGGGGEGGGPTGTWTGGHS